VLAASPNRRACEGEQERERGGVGSVPRGGRKTGERERAPGEAVGSVDSGDGMAPGSVVRGGVLAAEAG
jgi:hypothetical protein